MVHYDVEHQIEAVRKRKGLVKHVCNVKQVKKRLPILEWLPAYKLSTFAQDAIAGVTVGLTAIPQGMAYAVVAGLSPEYGLYSGLLGGIVYLVFGSCKDVTVGPTAITAAMVSKYVAGYSTDFAILAAFLAGIVELTMGILQLGFLVEFISGPVVSGFTTAAALQIAASQLKNLFGLTGASGNYFSESIYNFVKNAKTAKLWDPILGFITIGILFALKKFGEGCGRNDKLSKQLRWFISLARNALVVVIGIVVGYVLKITLDAEPLILIGDIGGGLPKFEVPPFSTVVGNETYSFSDMMTVLGPGSAIIPIVAIIETIAIAKAFAGGRQIDATQEMIAVGLCNIAGSFVGSIPVTGSFTRTALNYASGVQTTAGGIVTAALIVLALSLLTSTFYFIPRASLAGLIIAAMISMMDFSIFKTLWTISKKEFLVLMATFVVSLITGLEYGILAGVAVDAVFLLYNVARPDTKTVVVKNEKGDMIILPLAKIVSYCAAEHLRNKLIKIALNSKDDAKIVVDGSNVETLDTTVATNLITVAKDLDKKSRVIVFLNFNDKLQNMCLQLNPKCVDKFITCDKVGDITI